MSEETRTGDHAETARDTLQTLLAVPHLKAQDPRAGKGVLAQARKCARCNALEQDLDLDSIPVILLTVPARPVTEPPILSKDDRFVQRAREVVEAHLNDPAFNVDRMAAVLARDRSTVYRRLRSLVGQSCVEFIRSIRLEHAKKLLSARAGSVSEVAYAVGFQSHSHFSNQFVKKYGVTPSTYMRASR